MRCSWCLALACVFATATLSPPARAASTADTPAPADDDKIKWLPLGLQSYEPSSLGYTKNNDDVGFANVKLSVKFPLLPRWTQQHFHGADQFFLSFTGYWGFYVGTRPSGPVVGKEYNPQIFWQHNLSCQANSERKYEPRLTYASPPPPSLSDGDSNNDRSGPSQRPRPADLHCYFALGYNHDSNGQIINSSIQYFETQHNQGTEAANDGLSRGWDFIRLTGRYIPYWTDTDRITLYPTLKYFLSDGLLQGKAEELHDWEHPVDGKPRREVDGFNLLAKYQRQVAGWDAKLALAYTTGYLHPFKFSTVRLEAGIVILELPIVFWMQRGYMSDLSQYYRNVAGYGVQIEIGTF
jgi:hypothetical protein